MPTETGYIVEVRGTKAIVKTIRSEACSSCSSKGFCDTMGGKEVLVDANNKVGAAVGDAVMIEVSDSVFMTSSMVVYMIPVIFLIGGIALGEYIATPRGWDADLTGLLTGFAFLAIGLAGVRLIGNKAAEKNPRFTPTIISITNRAPSSMPGAKTLVQDKPDC